MDNIDVLPSQLSHVMWLGGGSGGAKSTMANRLVQEFGFTLYSTDDVIPEHASRSTAKDCPELERFKLMTMDQRWVERTPEVMLDTFHWFRGEGFRYIIDDLLNMPRDRTIVVEGFRVLPPLVKGLLTSKHQALWLLPTPEFRLTAFSSRGSMWDIAGKTTQPERALNNLLARDAMFTDRISKEAANLELFTISVDGSMSTDRLYDAVKRWFRINSNHVDDRPESTSL